MQETTKFQHEDGQYHGYSSLKNRLMRCLG